MVDATLATRIRARAYELWKLDGSLEGCEDEYWRMARAQEQEISQQKPAQTSVPVDLVRDEPTCLR
ncbi:DUF2934 domain-containing protein [Paraburkholderia sp. SIMBA_054]|uniref:DUF2934 domain-containing protein n=1 Tax=Paraburkholderia sp. SIMBA_054 TaxID=3085795 RepID=UPI00397E73F3